MDNPTKATLAVAVATLLLAIVTVWLARYGWRRDDSKRAEDSARRDQRDQEERSAQADREARQVIVDRHSPELARRIVISAPCTYPIKHPEIMWLYSNSNWSYEHPGGIRFPVEVNDGWVCYGFEVEENQYSHGGEPLVRFTDINGVRYYQLRHLTLRFKQNDDWQQAVERFKQWFSLGPAPDA